MQFPTAAFVIFFALALAGVWSLARWPVARKCWLVAAGGFFYSYWDSRFVLLLGGVVITTWGFGALIGRLRDSRARLALLASGIAVDLLVLAFFKYYGFFVDAVARGFSHLGVTVHPPLLQIALPVGISFYTFQSISYLVEVRRRRLAAATLLDVAAWLAFFPTVTSGPITRASEFLPQLAAPPDADRVDTARAYWLISRGLLKKLVLASFLASAITDKTFTDPRAQNSLTLLIGVYAYAAQIYCDFGGYTDLALGTAILMGFQLPENFDCPYTATSVQDFWSRWHMTLSRWLRDYLFAPLVGHRSRHRGQVYFGIVVVMLLAGLWHGAAWGFVAFGGVHGMAMASERWRREHRRRLGRPAPRRTWARQFARRVSTFHIVCLGWVFFASPSLSDAAALLDGLFTNWTLPVTLITPLLVLAIAVVLGMQYVPKGLGRQLSAWAARRSLVFQGVAFAAASVPILAMAPTTVPAFIYYRF